MTIDRQPHIVPVTYAADADGNVVFRTGTETVLTKVDLERVAFEVDGVDPRRGPAGASGARLRSRDHRRRRSTARHLRQKLGASWAPGPRPVWYVIAAPQFTGRRLQIARRSSTTRGRSARSPVVLCRSGSDTGSEGHLASHSSDEGPFSGRSATRETRK